MNTVAKFRRWFWIAAIAVATIGVFYAFDNLLPEANWKTYVNAHYGFSFRHPNLLECCTIAGPASGNPERIITLVPKFPPKGVDEPFDGLAMYVDQLSREDFQTYLAKEKQAELQNYYAFTGEEAPERGRELPINVGGRKGVLLRGYTWDRIDRIYVLFPDNQKVLVIAESQESEGSFNTIFSEILSTVRFIR